MLVGGKRKLHIPPELAYGPEPAGCFSDGWDFSVEVHQSHSRDLQMNNLDQERRLHMNTISLSSNRLTGELPIELARLTNLVDFRMSDNNFSGKLPDFIQNWKQLKTLRIQGTSLEGPIPSGISSLKNLSDLRISDLSGMGSVKLNYNWL